MLVRTGDEICIAFAALTRAPFRQKRIHSTGTTKRNSLCNEQGSCGYSKSDGSALRTTRRRRFELSAVSVCSLLLDNGQHGNELKIFIQSVPRWRNNSGTNVCLAIQGCPRLEPGTANSLRSGLRNEITHAVATLGVKQVSSSGGRIHCPHTRPQPHQCQQASDIAHFGDFMA